MNKYVLKKLILTSFLLLLSLSFPISEVFALPLCGDGKVHTTPEDPLKSIKNVTASFTIDMSFSKDPAFQSYSMEWQCASAFKQQNDNIPLNSDGTSITSSLTNSKTSDERCEFNPKIVNTIKVKGRTSSGDRDLCTASYQAVDINKGCTLELDPTSNITLGTNMKIAHIKGLSDGDTFAVLFDGRSEGNKSLTEANWRFEKNIKGPTFDNYTIPGWVMTAGNHRVSIRSLGNFLNPLEKPIGDSDLCNATFTVGTTENPGGVTGGGNANTGLGNTVAGTCKAGEAGCAGSAGQFCNTKSGEKIDPTTNPDAVDVGILTAIGCLPTTPIGIIGAILRLAVGAGGGIALLLMILGAFQMMISAGNPESLKKGRDQFIAAAIGLVFILFAVVIIQIIGVDLLNLPGFKKQ